MKRTALFLLNFSLFLSAGASGLYYWGHSAFYAAGPTAQAVRLVIPRGAGLNQIAEILHKAKVIENPRLFSWSARLLGGGRSIKAGEYEIEPAASQRAILNTLTIGKTVHRRITVPEGLSNSEIYKILAKAITLTGSVTESPEGTLLPETYSFERGATRSSLIHRMAVSMQDTVAHLWAGRAKDLPLDTPGQAVILASIVEKETGIPIERKRVAAVFLNRLRKGMRLQSDPTVVYGITLGQHRLGRALTRKDLITYTPYNTYRIAGLPPGPICNPGPKTIAAVLNPLESDELYFVADGTGGHLFAKTLAEHNRNVSKWRRLKKVREP